MNYELYVLDCETTGLDPVKHDPIEVSMYRLSDHKQETWFLKPTNPENIDLSALKVNGYNVDDVKGLTKLGREKYLPAEKVLVSMENWLSEDNCFANQRIMVGHNVGFDKSMLKELWKKCNSEQTFPFSDRYYIDTLQLEFAMDFAKGEFAEGYSLKYLLKKYAITNSKAHTAEADVKATVDLLSKQIDILKKLF